MYVHIVPLQIGQSICRNEKINDEDYEDGSVRGSTCE